MEHFISYILSINFANRLFSIIMVYSLGLCGCFLKTGFLSRTLGLVLTADSERVLSSLLGCPTELAMRETLAQMHCGNQDTECEDAMGHAERMELGAAPSSEGAAADADLEGEESRCFVPLDIAEGITDKRALIGKAIASAKMSQMLMVSLRERKGQQQEAGKCADERGDHDAAVVEANRLRAGDIVGTFIDGAAASRAQRTKKGVSAEAALVAVEVLRFYANAGLAVVSRRGVDGGGSCLDCGWLEKVVVVERDLWWLREGDACAPNGPSVAKAIADEPSDDEASGSDEEAAAAGQESPEKGADSASAADGVREGECEVEEEDFEDMKPRLDSAAKIKALKTEIDEQQLRLKQERARKLKVYEKQLDKEVKDGMKRTLKKMLVRICCSKNLFSENVVEDLLLLCWRACCCIDHMQTDYVRACVLVCAATIPS